MIGLVHSQGQLLIWQLCWIAGVACATYYRTVNWLPKLLEHAGDLHESVLTVAMGWLSYSYRCVWQKPWQSGLSINHKRGWQFRRQAGLLYKRKKNSFRITDFDHGHPVCHLSQSLTFTGFNQLWPAGITDVRQCSLVVILNALNHRGLGWALNLRLSASLALAVLRMVLTHRSVPAGLIDHSDCNLQPTSGLPFAQLTDYHIRIRMSVPPILMTTPKRKAFTQPSKKRKPI